MNAHPLRVFRKAQSPEMPLRTLAARLNVSTATISRWETGQRQPEPARLPAIVEATGIPPEKLRPDLATILSPEPQPDALAERLAS